MESGRVRRLANGMAVYGPNDAEAWQYDSITDIWQPWQAQGWLDTIQIPNPVAGTASVTHVTSGDVWEMPIRIVATLTADANVANRSVDVRVLNGNGQDFAGLDNALTIPANGQGIWIWERGQAIETSGQKGRKRSPMPEIMLAPSSSLILRVTGVQVGDTLTNMLWTFMRWRNVPRRLAQRETSQLAL